MAVGLFAGGASRADISNSTGTNVENGNNRATANQGGKSASGDAVGGQVTGVVSSGRTSVDARNNSSNSSVTSGDARGSNSASSFVGQNNVPGPTVIGTADITNSFATNVQDGNNSLTLNQTANESTGDGVAGQVIGAVTAAGGSTSIVAANRSDNVDITTGDARGGNDAAAFVGQNANDCTAAAGAGTATCTAGPQLTADITNSGQGANLQDGDNRGTLRQTSNATTGDGVAGQVIGAVSAGATSIDANNSSTNVSVDTGDATADNGVASFVGQNANFCTASSTAGGAASCFAGPVLTADVTNSSAANLQDGSNRGTSNQSATAATGDGVAGEVIGSVTSAGGSASIVAANTSSDSDVTTGDADATNGATPFVGQNFAGCSENASGTAATAACATGPFAADVTNSSAANIQNGSNRGTVNQTSNASTGDGVAGQVIGAVSAGATSIDARNSSSNVSVDTGDADAANASDLFVGQNLGGFTLTASTTGVTIVDVSNVPGSANVQDGSNRGTADQSATASSGDGVAGEVIGAVTSAGGSTSIVAANTSRDSDVTTGDADAANALTALVGQDSNRCHVTGDLGVFATCTVGPVLTADITNVDSDNLQDGNNRGTFGQTAASSSGDGVAGQVIGAVSAGATSIDANNSSSDVSVDTGDASSSNDIAALVGQNTSICGASVGGAATCTVGPVITADITGLDTGNAQDGNNTANLHQSASATTGDGVAGEVIGAVTSAGGSASIVAANSSSTSDVTTGDADTSNDLAAFVGQNISDCSAFSAGPATCAAGSLSAADITNGNAVNAQDGNNRFTAGQTAAAATGDGVAGQVLGVVSAGAASVDARNATTDSSVDTGDADSANTATAFVGQDVTTVTSVSLPAGGQTGDINGVAGQGGLPNNLQDGNNNKTLSQSANATSGDGVAGQVTGVVTSAGGSASVVLANTTTGVDSTSGDGRFDNTDHSFVGQEATNLALTIG